MPELCVQHLTCVVESPAKEEVAAVFVAEDGAPPARRHLGINLVVHATAAQTTDNAFQQLSDRGPRFSGLAMTKNLLILPLFLSALSCNSENKEENQTTLVEV